MKCSGNQHENRPCATSCEERAAPLDCGCAGCSAFISSTAKFCPECAYPIGKAAAAPGKFEAPKCYTPNRHAAKMFTSKPVLGGGRTRVTLRSADLRGSRKLLSDRDAEGANKQAALCPARTSRRCFVLLRSILTLVPFVVCAALSAQAADIEIEVRGIKVRTGQVHAALFANADDFSLDLAFRGMITREGEISIGVFTKDNHMPRPPAEFVSAPANARTIQLRMDDVAPGTYALALYQDVNDDGKLDTTINGVPLEPWGMSNNPRVSGRSPTWTEAQFILSPEGARLIIDLQ
jgi:uncharacterized protein (DUF2141 family)